MARRQGGGGRPRATSPKGPAPETLAQATRHHRAGRLAQAAKLYRRVLAADPEQPEAHHLLGVATLQAGDAAAAIEHIGRAIHRRPDAPAYHMNLGEAHRLAGHAAAAAASYARVLALDPGHFGARNNLANLHLAEGRHAEAIAGFRALLVERPDAPDARYNLANALAAAGQREDAMAAYRAVLERAQDHAGAALNLGQLLTEAGQAGAAIAPLERVLAAHPELPEAHYSLANALRDTDRLDEAVTHYRAALAARPDFVEAHFNLGVAEQERGHLDSAAACYRRVLDLAPTHARAHNNLGTVLAAAMRHEDAAAAYARAVALDPDFTEAQTTLGNALLEQGHIEAAESAYVAALRGGPSDGLRVKLATILPVIPRTMAEIDAARRRYAEGLARLEARGLALGDPLAEVGKTSFYLAYHGEDDRALQERLARLYARACPSLLHEAPHVAAGPRLADGRIHIGFVSRFLRNHTIGRLVAEHISRLDRTRFRVSVFFFPQAEDETARAIAQAADAVVRLPAGLDAARARIGAAALDVLYYPDIGMEPMSYFLAFARLAPIQCTSWGHPDTTGLLSIDYFLSAAALEPPGAEAHYTERLVRLATFNTCYRRPAPPSPLPDRAALGLPEAGTIYLCPQSLFKLRPNFDALLRRILEGDPAGWLVLVGGTIPAWTALLRARFETTLGAAATRVVFTPRLDYRAFHGLLARADVMLDTTVFGGANTTLEGLAMGTPIVSLPGAFARGRMSYACYRKMGEMSLVAADEDEYVRLALALGTDGDARQAARRSILASNAVLYDDEAPVRELEAFLIQAVAQPSSRTK